MMRLFRLAAVAGISTAVLFGRPALADLVVVSWGGAYTRSQIEAYHKPWIAKTGHTISSQVYNGGLTEVRAQAESGNVLWDVVDVAAADLDQGCDEGLFERFDVDELAPGSDGTSPRDDFVPSAIHPCGIGQMIWGTVLAFNPLNLAGEQPESIADFFDLKRFPGKRGLRRSPEISLEWALIADGVSIGDVYEVLRSPEGLARAFAKLDTIRNDVVWWDSGAQPPQLLADGEVTMSSSYNGRVMSPSAPQAFPVVLASLAWQMDYWAIPKGTRNLDDAFRFVKFATTPEQMRLQSSFVSYWPARLSAVSLLGGQDHYCTQGQCQCKGSNACSESCCESSRQVIFREGFPVSVDFWKQHKDQLNDYFNAWLAR